MKIFKSIAPYTVLTLLVFGLFWQLTKTFYQQDEWLALGNILTYGQDYFFLSTPDLLQMLLGEGRIASRGISYFLLGGFPFNTVPLLLFAIVLHIVNAILVYHLANKFFKNLTYSLFAASFFVVNSVAYQAVTWSAAAIGTLPATTLILLSFFAYFKAIGGYDFARTVLLGRRWIVVTASLIYISVHFKEIGIFLFVFLPLAAFLFKKYSFYSFTKTFWMFILPFLLIVAYRVIELRLRTTPSNLYITGLNENFFLTTFIRMIIYPLTSFSLMFIPGGYFLEFAREVLRDNYSFFSNSPNNILIAQTVVLDLLAVILTSILLLLFFIFLQKEKLADKKIVIFWLAFSFISFMPYVVLSKDFSYLESRYYYLPVAGAAFLLAWLLKRFWETLGPRIFFGMAVPLVILYIFFHANVVRGAIGEQVVLSDLRRNFMAQLKTEVPSLDKEKNAFYITGDQNYWADGNKIPFQQGSGYTLMVLYYDSGKIPKEFLKEGFLFDIGSQGYKESEELGFGYFWDKEELDKTVRLYNLPSESIIGLKYDSQTKRLIPTRNE